MRLSILFLALLIFLSFQIDAQKKCRVIIPDDVTIYDGKCKNGLAHGKGKAKGKDKYEGQFKKGKPHGIGTYHWQNKDYYKGHWQNGMRHGEGSMFFKSIRPDSVLAGIWKEDAYVGKKVERPRVIRKLNLDRHSFNRMGEGDQLTINILQNGRPNTRIQRFSIIGDSGTLASHSAPYILEGVRYPLKAKISYRTPNKMNTAEYDVSFEFEIPESGNWKLLLYN
jgi:hypothetical protein